MNLKNIFKLQLILLSFFLLTGCKDGGGAAVPPVGAIPGAPDDDDPTPGIVDDVGGFNVKTSAVGADSYYIHKVGDFDAVCKIPDDEAVVANRDIECIVEVDELEGMFSGVNMVVNVPTTSCSYILHTPYYFYAADAGPGPTAATVRFYKDGTVQGGSVTGPGQLTSNGQVACDYNYTGTPAANCCTGTYTLTTTTNFGEAEEATVIQTGLQWGGKVGNCIAGSGSDTSPRDAIYNMPKQIITNTPVGYSSRYQTGASVTTRYDSVYYANYFPSTVPAAFKIASPHPASPYYEWACLDDAHEVKGRIRVRIREWNAFAEFMLLAAGDPDTSGVEPTWGTLVNDYNDWEDIISGGDGFPGFNH